MSQETSINPESLDRSPPSSTNIDKIDNLSSSIIDLGSSNDFDVYTTLSNLSKDAIQNVNEFINTDKLAAIKSFEDNVRNELTDSYTTLHKQTVQQIEKLNELTNKLYNYCIQTQTDVITFNTLVNSILTEINNIYALYTRFSTLIQHNYITIHKIQHFVHTSVNTLVPFLPKSLFDGDHINTTTTNNPHCQTMSVRSIEELIQVRFVSPLSYTVNRHKFFNVIPTSLINSIDTTLETFNQQHYQPTCLHTLDPILSTHYRNQLVKNNDIISSTTNINQSKLSFSDLIFNSNPQLFTTYPGEMNDSINKKLSKDKLPTGLTTIRHTNTNKNNTSIKNQTLDDLMSDDDYEDQNYHNNNPNHQFQPQMFLFPIHLVDSILQFCTMDEIFNLMRVSKEWYYSIQQSNVFISILTAFNQVAHKLTYSHSVSKTLNQLSLPYHQTIPFELFYTSQWDTCHPNLINLLLYPPNILFNKTGAKKDRYSIKYNTTSQSTQSGGRSGTATASGQSNTVSRLSISDGNRNKNDNSENKDNTNTNNTNTNIDEDIITVYIRDILEKQTTSLQKLRFRPVLADKYAKQLQQRSTIATHPHYSIKITFDSTPTQNAPGGQYNVDVVSIELNDEQCREEDEYNAAIQASLEEYNSQQRGRSNTNDNININTSNNSKDNTNKTVCSRQYNNNESVSNARSILDLHLHFLQIELNKLQLSEELQGYKDQKYDLSLFKTNLSSQSDALTRNIAQLIHQLESDEHTLGFLRQQLSTVDAKIAKTEQEFIQRCEQYTKLIDQANTQLKSLQQAKTVTNTVIAELSMHTKVLNKEILNVGNNIKLANQYLLFLQQMTFQLNNSNFSIYQQYYNKNNNNDNNNNHQQQQQPQGSQQQLPSSPQSAQFTPKNNNTNNNNNTKKSPSNDSPSNKNTPTHQNSKPVSSNPINLTLSTDSTTQNQLNTTTKPNTTTNSNNKAHNTHNNNVDNNTNTNNPIDNYNTHVNNNINTSNNNDDDDDNNYDYLNNNNTTNLNGNNNNNNNNTSTSPVTKLSLQEELQACEDENTEYETHNIQMYDDQNQLHGSSNSASHYAQFLDFDNDGETFF